MKPGTKVRVLKYGSDTKGFPVGQVGEVVDHWGKNAHYIAVQFPQIDTALLTVGEVDIADAMDDNLPWLFYAAELEVLA